MRSSKVLKFVSASVLIACCLLPIAACAQVAQLRWDVQQDRPVAHDVYVWQGETVDLMPRLVQGTSPVAVTNAPVEFRYREAALATNQYRTVAASADTNSGVLSVRWVPDYDAGAAWYDYQIVVGSNAANPRCFGRITMRPTIGWPASTNPPPPVTLYPSRDDLQAVSNAFAGALQDLSGRIDALPPPPVVPVVSVNGYTGAVSITAASLGALTAEADPVAGPRLDLIEPEMDKWSAAYGWGNHALAGYLLPADLSPYATTQQVAEATAAIPRDRITTQDGSQWIDATGGVWKVVDTPATNWFYTDSFSPGVTSLLAGVDYPAPPNWYASTPNGAVDCFSDGEIYIYYGSVTFSEYAATIFATISATSATRFEDWFGWAEIFPLEIWSASTQRVDGVAWQSDIANADMAALRTYHYGSRDVVESPAEWFVFDGAGTITAFNWEAGRENVVIPWAIGGVPVTAIGVNAFAESGIVSVIAPQTVTVIGNGAFAYCPFLTSANIPQVIEIGDGAFYNCYLLTAVHIGQNAPSGATGVFYGITPPPNVYVTDPQATGWGAVWNGAPVVRPPLHGSNVTAQAYTLNGDTITEWPSGGGATNITDGVTQGTYDEVTRTLNISDLLAGVSVELPDGIVTNNYAGMVGLRDGLTVSGNSVFSNDLQVVGGARIGQTFFSADGSMYCYGAASMYAPYGFAWQYWTGSSIANAFYYDWNDVTANAYVPGGSLTVRDTVAASSFTATGTNTAAVLRSQSSIILPHYGTNTLVSLIFTNGTIQAWEIAQ